MKQEMTSHPKPLLNQALAVLREIQGWSQKRLSDASGIAVTTLSAYETGRRLLRRSRFDELAACLGFSPEVAEDVITWLRGFRSAEPGSVPVGLTPADVQEIEREAALVGRAVIEAARQQLTHTLQKSRAEEARRKAEDSWNTLRSFSPRERRLAIDSAPVFQTWALCERLCAESARAAPADARQAVELAELALQVACRVEEENFWRSRVQGYAWAHIGNARRVANQLPAANEAFVRARDLWQTGADNDPGWLNEGRLLDLEASLRRDQRRFPEALDLLDRALRLARTDSERGRVLANRAFALEQLGQYELAFEALKHAIPLVDRKREPRLVCVLLFNQAVALCHMGRHTEASSLIPVVRQMAIELRNDLDLIRVHWLEGRVARGQGHRTEAIEALSRVRVEFSALNLAYDSALSTLELAGLYLEEGRSSEVKALAREMSPIFKVQGVHAEALAALRLFQQAAEQEAATLELTNRLVEYLERARHDPKLRFAA